MRVVVKDNDVVYEIDCTPEEFRRLLVRKGGRQGQEQSKTVIPLDSDSYGARESAEFVEVARQKGSTTNPDKAMTYILKQSTSGGIYKMDVLNSRGEPWHTFNYGSITDPSSRIGEIVHYLENSNRETYSTRALFEASKYRGYRSDSSLRKGAIMIMEREGIIKEVSETPAFPLYKMIGGKSTVEMR